jgi:hypothetical protein
MIQNVAKTAMPPGQTWWTDLACKECSLLLQGPSEELLVKLFQCVTLYNANHRNTLFVTYRFCAGRQNPYA